MPDQDISQMLQGLDEGALLLKRHFLACGQNSKDQPEAIDADELATLQNADTIAQGVRKTRPGATLIADTVAGGTRVCGLGRFYVEGGTRYLTMVSGTKWYAWDGAASSWTQITGASLTSDKPAFLVVGGNRQFLLNGTDNVFSTADGATATDEGNTNTDPPKTRFGIYHQNMLLLAGSNTNTSYIWPSTVLATQTFDRASRAIKVYDQDSDSLTALLDISLTSSPGFLAFKNRKVAFVDTSTGGADPSQWVISVVDPAHGACGPWAVAAVGSSLYAGDCVYLAREGKKYRLRSLRRTVLDKFGTGGVLSFPVEDVLEDVNNSKMDGAIVYYFDQRVFVAVPSSGASYNDTLLVLDLKNSDPENQKWKWSKWSGWNVGQMTYYTENSVEYPYFGEASGATSVYRGLSGTSDNGSAITYQEESRREDFGYPELDKTFQFLEIVLLATDSTTVTVEVQIDGNGYTTVGTMSAASTTAPTLPVNLPFYLVSAAKIRKKFQLDNLGIGRDIQFRLTHSDVDTTVNIVGYTLLANADPVYLETRTS